MSISTKAVCDKITSLIASKTLNAAEAAALSVSCSLDVQTSTWAGLPSAACNEGRFYYVTDCCGYHYSDGTAWQNSVDSTSATPANLIYSVGFGASGQLGDNTTINKSSPVSIVGGFVDWSNVSAGIKHALGIRSDNTIWSWGNNGFGQLGDGTTSDKSSPISVIGGFVDWSKIAANSYFNVATKSNGTVWSWGCNDTGQLGDGTTLNRSSPVSVVGGFTDWLQISSGASRHVTGIRTDGTAWSWGGNPYGQLGDGTTINKSSPVVVVGGFADWYQISSGGTFATAIRTDGTAWSWGRNMYGQLGDNTTVNKSSPISIVGGFNDWSNVSNGRFHTIAVRTNGTAWGWGLNVFGHLGDNTTINKSSPVSIVGGFSDWCLVSGGFNQTVGLRANGTAWAWGYNGSGQFGNGTIVNTSSPVSVIGGFTDWTKASTGNNASFLLRTRG